MGFKLGHISDIHVFALGNKDPRRFLNKRILGGANLALKRAKTQNAQVVMAALRKLEELEIDHLSVTGDLTNLALEEEFEAAERIISTFRDATKRVSVIPGNHDYYTHKAAKQGLFERQFSEYMVGDLAIYQSGGAYPYCKLLGEHIALIGLNSGKPMPWFVAAGKIDERELRSLSQLLDDPALSKRAKVVMVHHPLLHYPHARVQRVRHLINGEELLRLLRSKDVELAIHGHNHHFEIHAVPHLRGDGTLHICEAGSTCVSSSSDPYFAGKFNVYHFEGAHLARIDTYIYKQDLDEFVLWRHPYDVITHEHAHHAK